MEKEIYEVVIAGSRKVIARFDSAESAEQLRDLNWDGGQFRDPKSGDDMWDPPTVCSARVFDGVMSYAESLPKEERRVFLFRVQRKDIRERALAKLTVEEREALGFS